MEKSYILPVILCGGSGTRLWPLSRASYPKQFSRLTGKRTLFQETLLRLSGSGYAAPILLTAERFRFIVAEQAAELGRKPQAIILEPESRNTAPAILAAALHVMKTDPDALLLVMPSDHYIPDAQAFRQAIAQGRDHAERGFIITLGIKPDRAETGYGYLELAETSAAKAIPLKSFVEKPSAEDARKMLKSGRHLWNAGIFFFSCRTMVEACEKHAPYLMEPVKEALAGAKEDLDFLRLDADAWARARDISIDYAVMEKAGNLVAVPYAGKWSDLGDWEAVWRAAPKDDDDNVLKGEVLAMDCQGSLLLNDAPDMQVVGMGLEDAIIVAMPDAVLVADRKQAQQVRQIVARLKERGADQATRFRKEHRPWGWFEKIAQGERFQVKRIVVKPGGSLSLQSHMHRAEHWVVVQGTAKVRIGEQEKLITENESVYVPLGVKHRLENPGKVSVILIEVQTGSYLGEDDIIRHDDIYSRS